MMSDEQASEPVSLCLGPLEDVDCFDPDSFTILLALCKSQRLIMRQASLFQSFLPRRSTKGPAGQSLQAWRIHGYGIRQAVLNCLEWGNVNYGACICSYLMASGKGFVYEV